MAKYVIGIRPVGSHERPNWRPMQVQNTEQRCFLAAFQTYEGTRAIPEFCHNDHRNNASMRIYRFFSWEYIVEFLD